MKLPKLELLKRLIRKDKDVYLSYCNCNRPTVYCEMIDSKVCYGN